jgi:hypothetical protein
VALALLALSASAAHACSCVKRSETQKFREAQFVFVGVVREAQHVTDVRAFGGGYVRAIVDVRETLKGAIGRHFTVVDQLPEGGMCSSFLRPGAEYVFFADELSAVGMCSGTRPLAATAHNRPAKLQELQDLKTRAGR